MIILIVVIAIFVIPFIIPRKEPKAIDRMANRIYKEHLRWRGQII
jgi:hypothetical protein